MKQFVSELNELLDPTITDDYTEDQISAIIRTAILKVFNTPEGQSNSDKTFRSLSLKLHPDKINQYPYGRFLISKNLQNLAFNILSVLKEQTQEHIPTTNYYPLNFAKQKVDFLKKYRLDISMVTKMSEGDAKEQNIKELDKQLKKEFAVLYYYENYPEWAQKIIYVFYALINTGIIASIISIGLSFLPFRLIVNPIAHYLLNIGTDTHYLHNAAETSALKLSILPTFSIDCSNIEDQTLKEIYNNLTYKTLESRKEKSFSIFSELPDEQIQLFFECLYVKEFINDLDKLSLLTHYLTRQKMSQEVISNFSSLLGYGLPSSDDKEMILNLSEQEKSLINCLFNTIRKMEDEDFEIKCKSFFDHEFLSAWQIVNSISTGIYQMAHDNTKSMMHRISRGLVLLISSPLIVLFCSQYFLTEIAWHSLMAIKLLSAQLVNAILNTSDYFNSNPCEKQQTAPCF